MKRAGGKVFLELILYTHNTHHIHRGRIFIMVLLFPHAITMHSYNYICSKLHSLGKIS